MHIGNKIQLCKHRSLRTSSLTSGPFSFGWTRRECTPVQREVFNFTSQIPSLQICFKSKKLQDTRCPQSITPLAHALCYYPCMFSRYVSNIFRVQHVWLLSLDCVSLTQLISHGEQILSLLLFFDGQLFSWPQLLSHKEHCLHYKAQSYQCA